MNMLRLSKPVLKLKRDVYFIFDPCKANGSHGQKSPTVGEILAREEILQFEHDMESLNMFMCPGCKEFTLSPSHQQVTWCIHVKPATNNKIRTIISRTIS